MGRVLAVYLEPAPYVLSLIEHLLARAEHQVDVLMVSPSLTQKWIVDSKKRPMEFLPRSMVRACYSLWNKLRRNHYDVLHLAGWGHPLLLAGLCFGIILKIPITIESDSQLIASGSGGATSRIKSIIKHIVYPRLFSFPKVFLPGGTRQANYLRHYGVSDERIVIAQMTSDVEAITKFCARSQNPGFGEVLRNDKIVQHTVRFLYLGRLEPHKGIEDLLEAFQLLISEFDQAVLLIAGDGKLSGLVANRTVTSSSIHYLGQLHDDDVWRAYCLADIFVIPSRVEPWGLVVNEAMAAGLPIIATTAVGCVDDLVHHEKNGLIVSPGNPLQLKAAMHLLAENHGVRDRMGSESKRIASRWTMANQAANLADAWDKALS